MNSDFENRDAEHQRRLLAQNKQTSKLDAQHENLPKIYMPLSPDHQQEFLNRYCGTLEVTLRSMEARQEAILQLTPQSAKVDELPHDNERTLTRLNTPRESLIELREYIISIHDGAVREKYGKEIQSALKSIEERRAPITPIQTELLDLEPKQSDKVPSYERDSIKGLWLDMLDHVQDRQQDLCRPQFEANKDCANRWKKLLELEREKQATIYDEHIALAQGQRSRSLIDRFLPTEKKRREQNLQDEKTAKLQAVDNLIASQNEAAAERNKPLNNMLSQLFVRTAYIDMLFSKERTPNFQHLIEHQIRQQQFLKQQIQFELKLNQEELKLQNKAWSLKESPDKEPLDMESSLQKLKGQHQRLLEMRYLQKQQIRQQQMLSQLSQPQQKTMAVAEIAEQIDSDISEIVHAVTPLLIKELRKQNTGLNIRFSPAHQVNKPNLTAHTLFNDVAEGKGYILVFGGQGQSQPKNKLVNSPMFQVLVVDSSLLENINATEFGTKITGRITKKDGVVLESATDQKRQSSGHVRI